MKMNRGNGWVEINFYDHENCEYDNEEYFDYYDDDTVNFRDSNKLKDWR